MGRRTDAGPFTNEQVASQLERLCCICDDGDVVEPDGAVLYDSGYPCPACIAAGRLRLFAAGVRPARSAEPREPFEPVKPTPLWRAWLARVWPWWG